MDRPISLLDWIPRIWLTIIIFETKFYGFVFIPLVSREQNKNAQT